MGAAMTPAYLLFFDEPFTQNERLAARAGDGEMITTDLARCEISECERRTAMMSDGRSIVPGKTDCDIHRDHPSAPAEVANVLNNAGYCRIASRQAGPGVLRWAITGHLQYRAQANG